MEIIHHHFPTLRSTNDWSRLSLSTFDTEKVTLVTTDMQTQGRGQYGRKWLVPPEGGNFTGTYTFFVPDNAFFALSFTHLLALTVVNILEERGLEVQIKWPNDLFIHQKKVAGILCETEARGPLLAIILGMGLNLNASKEFLASVGQEATSVSIETGKKVDYQVMLSLLNERFLKNLTLFLQEGFYPFAADFQNHLIKARVRVQSDPK